MNKNTILKSVIKQVLKEVSNEKSLQKSNIVETVNTYKQPNGIGFLIPKDWVYGSASKYNKQDWMDWYADFSNARKQFDLILKNKDKTYRSLCCDEQRTLLIYEFILVRDKWIPDNILDNKWGLDKGVIEEADEIMKYYIQRPLEWEKETHYSFLDGIDGYKPSINQCLDGTDYFFMLMQKWISSTPAYANSVTFSKENYQSHIRLTPNFTVKNINNLQVGYWMWGIDKSEFCDTKGQWLSYFKEKGDFVKNLAESSVYSFKIKKNKFIKWAEATTWIKGKEMYINDLVVGERNSDDAPEGSRFDVIEKETNEESIEFTACHAYNEDGEYQFQGYFSNWNKPTEKNIGLGRAYKCSGIKFPNNGEILGFSNVTTVTQEGGFLTSEKLEEGGVVEIPLIELTAGNLGQFYKQFVADPRDDMSELGSSIYNFAISLSAVMKVTQNQIGSEVVDPTNYENQLEIPIETPLQMYSGDAFDEDMFIGHTKITENTEVFRVPQEGLSQYIPGAKKSNSGKWYIIFSAGEQNLRIFLPPKEWWADYYDMTYKIKNVITNFSNNNEYPEFAWTLVLQTSADISSAITTFGADGWKFKISQEGGMFFTNKIGQKNYNEKGYFQQNNMQISYNFLDVKQMDSRSKFGSFMESGWGILAQVAIGIAIAAWLAPAASVAFLAWAESTTFASTAIGTTLLQYAAGTGVFVSSRLQIFLTIGFELGILGVPLATYYNSRGDDIGVWLSILLCFLPLGLETKGWSGFTKRLWEGSSPKTLSMKLLRLGKGVLNAQMTSKDLISIIKSLDNKEAMIFGELIKNVNQLTETELKEIIKSAGKTLAEAALEDPEVLKRLIMTKSANFAKGGINLLGTSAAVFSSVVLVQTLGSFFKKQRVLTPEETKILEKGIVEANNFFANKFQKNVIEKIKADMSSNSLNLKLEVPEVWMENFFKQNFDMFEKMLVEGGWQSIESQVYNSYVAESKNNLLSVPNLGAFLSSDLQLLAKNLGLDIKGLFEDSYKYIPELIEENDINFSYKFNKGEISKKEKNKEIWVVIQDDVEKLSIFEKYFKKKITELNKIGEFSDELLMVRKEFPCLTDDKFIFVGGNSEEFYLTFIPTSGSFKGVEIYVIYNYETDNIDNDYKITYTDSSGWAQFLPENIIKEYGC